MLKFDFTSDKVVEWPVKIREPRDGGGITEHKFKAKFRLLPQDEQDRLLEEQRGDFDRALLRTAVQGWDDQVRDHNGEVVEFSAETLEALIRYPFIRTGFLSAYFEASSGSKAKN